jgi:adenylate cyclase
MDNPPTETHRHSLLIVDDTPDNLHLLTRILVKNGYHVRGAINGKMALNAIQLAPPDLILLDISMPMMSGYEVCQALKTDDRTREIPVIFLSALSEVGDKIKAFEVGGVDYITKPFQSKEVLARVEVHLNLQRLQHQLQVQNIQLQQEITARQEAEEKYRSIFENCVEGIFQSNLNGTYLSANPSLAKMYGYETVQELITSITSIEQMVYVQPDRLQQLQAYLHQHQQVTDFESQVYRKDGSLIWVSETVRETRDQQGELLFYEGTVRDITEQKQAEAELYQQRLQTEKLLLNVLPQSIAERLKQKQDTIADSFDQVTVMFADVVNFTPMAARISPTTLVNLLNQIFSSFDQLAEQYGLEKIKTIGDAYLVAAGVPIPRPDHAFAVADMALAMQQVITQIKSDLGEPFQLRIGINTGAIVAGVIGKKKFTYDLWGNAVNLASRMQTQAEPGTIQLTATTYELLQAHYRLEERGSIEVKGIGQVATYRLQGKK